MLKDESGVQIMSIRGVGNFSVSFSNKLIVIEAAILIWPLLFYFVLRSEDYTAFSFSSFQIGKAYIAILGLICRL